MAQARTVSQLHDLTGRSALITGASRGLGLQMAHALGEAGARLLISARKQADLDAAATELRAAGHTVDGFAADGRDVAQVTALVDHALRTFPDHRARQQAAFAHTFALEQRPCSERAAEAVVDAIVQAKRSRRPSPSHPPLSPAFRREPVP